MAIGLVLADVVLVVDGVSVGVLEVSGNVVVVVVPRSEGADGSHSSVVLGVLEANVVSLVPLEGRVVGWVEVAS